MHGITHLHRGALRADAGEGQMNRRVGRSNTDLALRQTQCPRRHHADEIMSSLADLRRVMLNRHHTASIHCRHRIGPAAALRTVTKTKRHTTPSRPTRPGSRRFVARLAIGPTVPGDSRYGLLHEIEIIRVHE